MSKVISFCFGLGVITLKSRAIQYSTSQTKNSTFTRNFKKTFFLDLEDGNVMVT